MRNAPSFSVTPPPRARCGRSASRKPRSVVEISDDEEDEPTSGAFSKVQTQARFDGDSEESGAFTKGQMAQLQAMFQSFMQTVIVSRH